MIFMVIICRFIGQLYLEAEKTWLQCECNRWGNKYKLDSEYDCYIRMLIGNVNEINCRQCWLRLMSANQCQR